MMTCNSRMSFERDAPLVYNSHLEQLVASEGEKALSYQWLHDQAEKVFSRWTNCIALPVIILSTLSGTAAIGQSTLFGDSPMSSVGIGLVSILVGILNTISQHFGVAKRAEGHRIASITYGKLYRLISVELSLPREQRMAADQFIKVVRDQIDRLAETSPPIPESIIAAYKARFAPLPTGISIPECCNGLHKIDIHPVRSFDAAIASIFRGPEIECRRPEPPPSLPQLVSEPMYISPGDERS